MNKETDKIAKLIILGGKVSFNYLLPESQRNK